MSIEVTDLPEDVPADAVVVEANRRYVLRDDEGERRVYLTGVREDLAHGVDAETGRRVSLEDPETLAARGRLLPVEAVEK